MTLLHDTSITLLGTCDGRHFCWAAAAAAAETKRSNTRRPNHLLSLSLVKRADIVVALLPSQCLTAVEACLLLHFPAASIPSHPRLLFHTSSPGNFISRPQCVVSISSSLQHQQTVASSQLFTRTLAPSLTRACKKSNSSQTVDSSSPNNSTLSVSRA